LICPHSVNITVSWYNHGVKKKRSVSPVSLLCTQSLWSNYDIVSDESDSDSESESVPNVECFLPKLKIDVLNHSVIELDINKKKALKSMIKETNQLFNCLLNFSNN
jgi:hypothetical protein